MIEATLEKWLQFVHGEDVGDRSVFLDELLAPDVVFYSPVVFTPQEGRAVTKLYLMAAGSTFGGDDAGADAKAAEKERGGGFRYTKKPVLRPYPLPRLYLTESLLIGRCENAA